MATRKKPSLSAPVAETAKPETAKPETAAVQKPTAVQKPAAVQKPVGKGKAAGRSEVAESKTPASVEQTAPPPVVQAAPPVAETKAPALESGAKATAAKSKRAGTPSAKSGGKPASRTDAADAADAADADDAATTDADDTTTPAESALLDGPEPVVAAQAPKLAAKAPAPPAMEPLPTLPDAFGSDRIVVMARDPESAFIYWELTPEGVARARGALGLSSERANLMLRVYRGDAEAARFDDFPVNDWLGRYTWMTDQPGQRISASIGFLADGVFVHITQGLPTRLPRRTPGDAPVRFVRIGPKALTPAESANPPAASGIRSQFSFPATAPGGVPALPAQGESFAGPAGSGHLTSRGPGASSGGVR